MPAQEDTVKWLKWFGYLDDENPTDDQITMAVAAMQKIYGLVIDGDPGPITQSAMKLFRCAQHDTGMLRQTDGDNAVATPHDDCRMTKSLVTYAIDPSFRLGGNASNSRQIIRYGFKFYEPLTGITFQEVSNLEDADIRIGQAKSPNFWFDGPGNVLAWASYPCREDQDYQVAMFDESEPWNLNVTGPGVIMINVWLHELGHLLGLQHSDNPADLMAPFYNPQILEPQQGDIARITTLYGVDLPEPTEAAQGPMVPGLPYGPYSISGTMILRDDGGVALSLDRVSPK